jgi:hypothetical protein
MLRAIFSAFATVIFIVGANGQSMLLRDQGPRDDGPRSLLDAMLGISTEIDQSQDEERLDPDRPHFPEATTAVGKDRAILETGYTFTNKKRALFSHSYPEALLRVGLVANWFEFRTGQNFLNEQQEIAGAPANISGPLDLYLGVKLAVARQQSWLPAVAVIPQMTAPTGSRALTAGRIMPGLNLDFSWEIAKDVFGIELLVANNQVLDDLGGNQHQFATGLTGVLQLSEKLELFAEWDAFYFKGGLDSARPQHYAVGGLVFFATPNLALDGRVGIGLNDRANAYLAGAGLAVRF